MKNDITKLVEEHPDVKRLKKEIVQRTNRLHKEILALGLSLQNIRRFLKIYEEFHYMVCKNNPRNYSHARFVNDILAGEDLLKKYKETINSRWMFPSPQNPDVPRYPTSVGDILSILLKRAGCKQVAAQNLELKKENQWLKDEIDRLNRENEWKKRVDAMWNDESTYLNPETECEEDYHIVQDKQLIEFLCRPINELTLSNRTHRLIGKFGFDTIGELIEIPEEAIMKCRGFGIKSLKELKDALATYKLELGMKIRWKPVEED